MARKAIQGKLVDDEVARKQNNDTFDQRYNDNV